MCSYKANPLEMETRPFSLESLHFQPARFALPDLIELRLGCSRFSVPTQLPF